MKLSPVGDLRGALKLFHLSVPARMKVLCGDG